MSRKALRRTLWLLFLFTIPLPYYVGAAEWAPAARLAFLALLLGVVGLAEGLTGATGLFILLGVVEALVAIGALYLLARLAARLLEGLRPTTRRLALTGTALVLLCVSLFDIYETPMSSTRTYSNLLHLFE